MRKGILYIVGTCAVLVYLLAANTSFMRWYNETMIFSRKKWFKSNREMYGDLYSLSYIPEFKISGNTLARDIPRADTANPVFDIYIISDSYLEQADKATIDSTFHRSSLVKRYYPTGDGFGSQSVEFINNGRKKILLFERAERFLVPEYSDTGQIPKYLKLFAGGVVMRNPSPPVGKQVNSIPAASTAIGAAPYQFSLKRNFKTAVMNQNLEVLLYGYGMFQPLKELKAAFNYRLFKRVSSKVALSENGRNLFIKELVDPKNDLSSYFPASSASIDSSAMNLNKIADHYKSLGFDEVVFSFIPSTPSILQPQGYNHVIERITQKMRYPTIDIYTIFRKHPNPEILYRRSDTHWDREGYRIWVEAVNDWLKQYIKKPLADANGFKN